MSHSAITLLTILYDPTDLILFRPVETWTESRRKRSRVDISNVCYRPAKLKTLDQTLTRLLESSETERTELSIKLLLNDSRFGCLLLRARTIQLTIEWLTHI